MHRNLCIILCILCIIFFRFGGLPKSDLCFFTGKTGLFLYSRLSSEIYLHFTLTPLSIGSTLFRKIGTPFSFFYLFFYLFFLFFFLCIFLCISYAFFFFFLKKKRGFFFFFFFFFTFFCNKLYLPWIF